MKKILFYIFICLSVGLTSCVDEDIEIKGKLGEGETMARLKFGHNSFEEIQVNSRATLDKNAESRIENLFVYIFDHTGKRVYSHFFDYSSKVDELPVEIGNYWTVRNYIKEGDQDTHGEILMKVPVLEGGSIYVIANLNADMMNISADQLYLIESLDALRELNESLSQEITSRSGYFLMSGSESNINIAENGAITKDNKAVQIQLDRLDAKVSVNIKLGESKITGQELVRFVPESWQVMRLPKACRLLKGVGNADELGFFDSEEHFFEKLDDAKKEYEFSFYTLENIKRSTGLDKYHQREERHKNADGTYDLEKGMWKHVDDNATYMVIKGRLQMKVDTHKLHEMQHLEADVTYFVHLGDFGSSENGGGDVNDFSAERNTHYKYSITVNGVNNIEVEVVKDEENQSGAIGDVYKSREEILTYDAHYGQRVYCIDSRDVDANTLTWYVKTPFGEGRPGLEFGTENPNLDYKWAWFMVNEGLSKKNQWYPGDDYQKTPEDEEYKDDDKLWNAMEFTEWLRAEKIKFDNAPDSEKGTASAFKYLSSENRYVIYVTVFVDEYFYEKHPLTGAVSQDLWKQFVNKQNRIMHILCDSRKSKDGDSSLTNSIITLRQRSIQSPYNIDKPGLNTAWGCETEDEFVNSQLFYFDSYNETMAGVPYPSTYNLGFSPSTYSASDYNGLYNSVKMWGIDPNTSRWDDYFDYTKENDDSCIIQGGVYSTVHFLKKECASLRYSSLMRNRDCDGDKIIDADELKWYVATLPQLYDLFIGEPGLDPEAHLYPYEKNKYMGNIVGETRENEYKDKEYIGGPYNEAYMWRLHIIPSTWVNKGGAAFPQVLWAEETFSLSHYRENAAWGSWHLFAPLSTRSVRNLGINRYTYLDEGTENIDYPTMLITPEPDNEDNPTTYYFDLSNLNTKSLRYFTTHELELGDENFETSYAYYGFETGTPFKIYEKDGANNLQNYNALIADLENGVKISPQGYRVPNVRECAIMALYCNNKWWDFNKDNNSDNDHAMVSTIYSSGIYGNVTRNFDTNSWQFGYKAATLGYTDAHYIIPVKDVRK